MFLLASEMWSFPLLSIIDRVNKTAITIHEQISCEHDISFLSYITWKSSFGGPMATQCLTFSESDRDCFLKHLYHFAFHTNKVGFKSPHILSIVSVVYSSGYKMVFICLMSNGIKYLFMILLTSCIFSLKTHLSKSLACFKTMLFIDTRYFYDCGQICGMLEGLRDHQYLIVALSLTHVTSRKIN